MRLWRWTKMLCTWKYKPDPLSRLITADAIVGLSFAQRRGQSSPSNQAIAKIVTDLYNVRQQPLMLQWEVADLVPRLPIVKVFREHRRPGEYLSAFECLYQAAEVCRANEWKHITLVTHPGLILRASWITERLGLVPVFAYVSSVPYDPFSNQWWTRGPRRWHLREPLERGHHMWHDWI